VWRPPTIRAVPRRPARRQARGQYLPLYLVGLPPATYIPAYVGVDSTTTGGTLDGATSGGNTDGVTTAGGLDGTTTTGGLDGVSGPAGIVE